MKTLNEIKVLTNVHLSDSQKMVMTKIKVAANPNVAGEQARNNTNMATAQKTLIKLGLVMADESGATLTDKGIKTLTDENLLDDSGELTPEGQKYVDAKDLTALTIKNNNEPSSEPQVPNTSENDLPLGESLSLFKDIHAMANMLQL